MVIFFIELDRKKEYFIAVKLNPKWGFNRINFHRFAPYKNWKHGKSFGAKNI